MSIQLGRAADRADRPKGAAGEGKAARRDGRTNGRTDEPHERTHEGLDTEFVNIIGKAEAAPVP